MLRSLGVSERRVLLDVELERLGPSLFGVVLDVGGRRRLRGRFTPPAGQCKRWIRINVDLGAGPDLAADATALPVRGATADAVLCAETLQYVDRPERAMAEFSRVLAPGGRVILSAPFLHRADTATDRHRFTAARLEELAASAGLAVERLTSQGLFFTTLGSFLRQGAAAVAWRPLRIAAAVVVAPLVGGLGWLDRLPAARRSPFLASFSTGFLLVARKP